MSTLGFDIEFARRDCVQCRARLQIFESVAGDDHAGRRFLNKDPRGVQHRRL